MLLGAPRAASLEVINDANGFVANFWRSVVHQTELVARAADYPVSHIDLGARHQWLMDQRDRLGAELQDPDWPGDPKVAGWWLWGQCAWIGSGWCDWDRKQIPHVSNAGMGIQATGQIPHVSSAGMGIQATGQIPNVSSAGPVFWTSAGEAAMGWLSKLANRMERVRIVHGDWKRCLNSRYGGNNTAVFLDPPYVGFGEVYGTGERTVAQDVAEWCKENAGLRVALCGHVGDYELPGWELFQWDRPGNTYSGSGTKDKEAIWFSPTCLKVKATGQIALSFAGG
jgi:hypothetical protein